MSRDTSIASRPSLNPLRRPVATYRLQFHSGWPLPRAQSQLHYLEALGVTDLYASPLLEARPGSPHGYDVCNPHHLNPEVGGPRDWASLQQQLKSRQMGLLLDIVPNHMGIGHPANLWWWDVLQLGETSAFAHHFDIHWTATDAIRQIELPVLGQPLEDCVRQGQLQIFFEDGAFLLAYFDHRFPLSPETWERLLRAAGLLVGQEGDQLTRSLRSWALGDFLQGPEVQSRLRQWHEEIPDRRNAIENLLVTLRDSAQEVLPKLLPHQHYRLSFWRRGRPNYRRFFDISDLAAVRVEDPEVFEAVHRKILEWVGRGEVTGLRVDHPDGLRDPAAYFLRLQAACLARLHHPPDQWTQATTDYLSLLPRLLAGEEGRNRTPPFHVLGEKILADQESLPSDWCLHGTTGYDFLRVVNGLFVHPAGWRALRRVYAACTGETRSFAEVAWEGKRDALNQLFEGEMTSLTQRLHALASRHAKASSLQPKQWAEILREWICALPVYRTYLSRDHATPGREEREQIHHATREAIRVNPSLPAHGFAFLQGLLAPASPAEQEGLDRDEILEFAMRLQQLTGPATAKGVEDTAFYRYYNLCSLNEVGGEPGHPGTSLQAFHQFMQQRQQHWPHALSATATHDTKRGEDLRARLHVLSELTEPWEEEVSGWINSLAHLKSDVDGKPAPSANDEYLIYQTLLGAWPAETPAESLPKDFGPRLSAYLTKAVKESKRESSWLDPNAAYEEATSRFIEGLLREASFLRRFLPFQKRLARAGVLNSLAQSLLKITAPGIPDLYQGTELWDLSLVDPDNRRPVDYERRHQLLPAIRLAWEASASRPEALREWLREWPDGRIKLFTLWRALQCRRQHSMLFAHGTYEPVLAEGPREDHVCAFLRQHHEQAVLVVVPRFLAEFLPAEGTPLVPPDFWEETQLTPPPGLEAWHWEDVFTGQSLRGGREVLKLCQLMAHFPIALLRGRPPRADHRRTDH